MSGAPTPDRQSRQELVVPPRESNVTILLGAVACGCIGFGVVWALGLGRPAGRDVADAAEAATTEEVAGTDHQPGDAPPPIGTASEPAMFSAPVGGVEPMPVDPWRSRTGAAEEGTGGRYAGRTTAFSRTGDPEADPQSAGTESEPLAADPLPQDLQPLPDETPSPDEPAATDEAAAPEPDLGFTDAVSPPPADDLGPTAGAAPPPADDPPPGDLIDRARQPVDAARAIGRRQAREIVEQHRPGHRRSHSVAGLPLGWRLTRCVRPAT